MKIIYYHYQIEREEIYFGKFLVKMKNIKNTLVKEKKKNVKKREKNKKKRKKKTIKETNK